MRTKASGQWKGKGNKLPPFWEAPRLKGKYPEPWKSYRSHATSPARLGQGTAFENIDCNSVKEKKQALLGGVWGKAPKSVSDTAP